MLLVIVIPWKLLFHILTGVQGTRRTQWSWFRRTERRKDMNSQPTLLPLSTLNTSRFYQLSYILDIL